MTICPKASRYATLLARAASTSPEANIDAVTATSRCQTASSWPASSANSPPADAAPATVPAMTLANAATLAPSC